MKIMNDFQYQPLLNFDLNENGHPSNATDDFSMVTSRDSSNANSVMSRSTLRNCFTVVSCQLARLRLLPTAQAMKTCDANGLNTTLVRPEQRPNALMPIFVSAGGR